MRVCARQRAPDVAAPLVFITGASSGIGQALAWRYYLAGYRLALVARRSSVVAQWAADAGIETARLAVHAADFADLEVLRATYETNNLGMAATFQPFVAALVARGSGRLVGIASVAGIRGLPGHGAYCSSKAAAISYCESLRGELRPSGVKVVTIAPGYIDTPLTKGNLYSMPFLMSASAFADRAFRAIDSVATWRVIPCQMGMVARLLRIMPNALYDRLLAGRPRKQRKAN